MQLVLQRMNRRLPIVVVVVAMAITLSRRTRANSGQIRNTGVAGQQNRQTQLETIILHLMYRRVRVLTDDRSCTNAAIVGTEWPRAQRLCTMTTQTGIDDPVLTITNQWLESYAMYTRLRLAGVDPAIAGITVNLFSKKNALEENDNGQAGLG